MTKKLKHEVCCVSCGTLTIQLLSKFVRRLIAWILEVNPRRVYVGDGQWHWTRILPQYFGFLLSIIIPPTLHIIRHRDNGDHHTPQEQCLALPRQIQQ